jgi:flavin-dependent dehydrogenase
VYDLIVVGGGPAGTSAAITAARAGARVLMLERGRFPRHKVCGEFVSAESLGLLLELLTSQHQSLLREAIRIPRARVFLDGRLLRTPVHPPAASIARLDLDLALWESARDRGVDTRQQITVLRVVSSNPFRIATSEGEFEARAMVNASGRWSNLTTPPADNRQASEKWLGLKAHFLESSPSASVDLYFFEGGYCGVQPVDLNAEDPRNRRVNACAMVRAEVASTLLQVFDQHAALRERSRHWQPLSDPVSTSPLIFRQPQAERDGILMVGDAAGFVDPFVGDGISLALRSGALAAQSLTPFLIGKASLPEALHSYRQAYQHRLIPIFRASSKIRQMLRLPRPVRKPLLSLLGKTPALTRILVDKTR